MKEYSIGYNSSYSVMAETEEEALKEFEMQVQMDNDCEIEFVQCFDGNKMLYEKYMR